jgi:hypothetical protein
MLSFTSVVILAGIMGRDEEDYIYAPFDKLQLLASTPGPRIILIGGSSIGFGIDSKEIKRALGVNVVNLGIHAGLGLRYMTNMVKPYIRKHDTIILVPEYHQFYDGYFEGGEALAQLALMYPELRGFIHPKSQYFHLLQSVPGIVQKMLYETRLFSEHFKTNDKIYYRHAFNELGDAVSHLDKKSGVNISSLRMFPNKQPVFDPATVSLLNEFSVFCRDKGVRAYFLYPAIPDLQFEASKGLISDLDTYLKEHLEIPVMCTPEYFVLSPKYFFDTIYHLKKPGIEIRTKKAIAILRKIVTDEKRITGNFS